MRRSFTLEHSTHLRKCKRELPEKRWRNESYRADAQRPTVDDVSRSKQPEGYSIGPVTTRSALTGPDASFKRGETSGPHATREDDDLLDSSGGGSEEVKGRRTVQLVKAIFILAAVALGLRWFFATRIVSIRNRSSNDMGPLVVELEGVASRQVILPKGERRRFVLNGWPARDTGLRILDMHDGAARELLSCGYESRGSGSSHYVIVLFDDGKSSCEPIFSFNPLFNLD